MVSHIVRLAQIALLLALAAPLATQHPQAVTDCANCHVDPDTGIRTMWGIHDYRCELCHPNFEFDRTILGPIGTWNHECSACHQPAMAQTGNLPVMTKGHRCVVCHGRQMPTSDPVGFHAEHTQRADCAVCHGRVPDLGTVIGSGDRQSCALCHRRAQTANVRTLHSEMTRRGLACNECHGGTRPPIDVLPSVPVGNAVVVCDICHTGRDASAFHGRSPAMHRQHRQRGLECGSCHADANLQGDSEPMLPHDDARRQLWNRAGRSECANCHGSTPSASTTTVHQRHVGMWCYDCHEGTDLRPLGQEPPVTAARQACLLCHGNRTFSGAFPFELHQEHLEEINGMKCYTCHQGTPPITGWPQRWLRTPGVLATYGSGCAGSASPPTLTMTGTPRLGRSFQVRLEGAAQLVPAAVAIGGRGQAMDMEIYGMKRCMLLVDEPDVVAAVTDSNGRASFAQAVPSSPQLVGEALYYQWFAVSPGANAAGVAATNAGRVAIGQ